MLELLLIVFAAMFLGGFIRLAWAATWGIFKILGVLLSVVAFPIIFIGILVLGLGAYLFLPIMLLVLAFGCIVKA
ncbi:MAG: hypothetical protein IKT25_06895 [Firmicutes bacterium]|nr:hypothetical protein [Bacillota bacterium]MBR5001317.1 hypothetical protein [Bacillota bacterium]MBR6501216.1 hypothetical protein [Bacillota bacterium]